MNRSFRATLSLVVAALPLAVPTAHAEGAGKCRLA
jgi:hypothetical protein